VGWAKSVKPADFHIWQGNFTAVNATCLQVWHGDSAGDSEPSKEHYGAFVIDVFADRIVFRRFVVREGASGKVQYHSAKIERID